MEYPEVHPTDQYQPGQELSLSLHIKREPEDDGDQTDDFITEVAHLSKRPRQELDLDSSVQHLDGQDQDAYRCQTCTKVFSNPDNVRRHAWRCSGVGKGIATVNGIAQFFPNPEQPFYVNELKQEEQPLPLRKSGKWRCLVCHKILSNFESLRRHFKIFHSSDDPKAFSARLTQAEVLELEEKSAQESAKHHVTFPCNFCGKSSTRAHDLKRHIQRIHFYCTDCSTKFESQAEVTKHLNSCSKDTSMRKSNLSYQELPGLGDHAHLGSYGHGQSQVQRETYDVAPGNESPLNLKVSDPTTSSAHHKEAPIAEHASGSGVNARFQDSTSSEMTDWKCFACNKFFANAFSLRRHVEGVHMKAYNCTTCGKSFICKWRLSHHAASCSGQVGPGVQVNPGDHEVTEALVKSKSGMTSTPFTSKLSSRSNGKLEISPIPHSKQSLEFSRLDDSGIQQNSNIFNLTPAPFQDQPYPFIPPTQLAIPGPSIKVDHQERVAPASSHEPSNEIQTDPNPDTAPDVWTALRTIIFLRALQMARLSLQLPIAPELMIKQDAATEPPLNNSGQQDSDSGNGSNQNSDSEPKSDPIRGNQNNQLNNVEVTPGVLKAKRRSNRLNRSSSAIYNPGVLTNQADDDQKKSFQCKDCPKVFGRKDGLARHVEMKHLNITHECKECGSSFKNKFYLEDHVRGIHERSQQLNCAECDKEFSLKSALYRHKQNVHKKDTSSKTIRTEPGLGKQEELFA